MASISGQNNAMPSHPSAISDFVSSRQTCPGGATHEQRTTHILASELLGYLDVTQPESTTPQSFLPAIWEDGSEVRNESLEACLPTVTEKVMIGVPVMDGPISDSDRSSNSPLEDINHHFQAPTAEDIALNEFYIKWEGTNLLQETDTGKRLPKETMESLINARSEMERSIKENPYDPLEWLHLAGVYFDLCYSDLQVSTAHKALILIRHGLNFNERSLGQIVRISIGKRLSCFLILAITEELDVMRLNAYITLLRGLYDAASYWDGLKEAKTALKLYPGNKNILAIHGMLKHDFTVRVNFLKRSKAASHELKYLRQCGRMNKKQYPWMDEKLFLRTPANLSTFNQELNSKNCEIRRAQFKSLTPHPKSGLETSNDNNNDVGPLGIFATRDIRKDEVLLIDHNTTLVSNIPPSKMTQCEACHASLHPAFLDPSEVRVAECCKAVAYCSATCHDLATNGYHRILCGQDFKWLYESTSGAGAPGMDNASWRPLTLLRLLAVIISDFEFPSASKRRQRRPDPLQHPLIARLTANYTPGESSEQEWNYFSHVIAPNRILMQLGVDIFSDLEWSTEVIHTLYWRMVNNACKISSIVIGEDASSPEGLKIETYTITGISPGYIFFNHGCKPTVSWMAAGDGCGTRLLDKQKPEADRKRVKIGGSAMLCIAMTDLKKDEEARISYVPKGHEDALDRWFEGGCGCGDCGENTKRVTASEGEQMVLVEVGEE